MTDNAPVKQPPTKTQTSAAPMSTSTPEKILCPHCLRTATNGFKCQGICVADSDY